MFRMDTVLSVGVFSGAEAGAHQYANTIKINLFKLYLDYNINWLFHLKIVKGIFFLYR